MRLYNKLLNTLHYLDPIEPYKLIHAYIRLL
nr:MAG TPA: hypothetical protein [Caudoviricetes sp.]DAK48707.1 MAG TPA: hypothetical protein [Caudoviricetes sp.]DAN44805.1 MAG TPA: hypothetical protein [Caudoviricetes sp.]